MKSLRREKRCYYVDSKAHKTTDSEWLQGGLMNVITGKMSSLIQHHQLKLDKIGRWMARRVSNEKIHYSQCHCVECHKAQIKEHRRKFLNSIR